MGDREAFRSPFEGLAASAAHAGVRVRDRSSLGLAAIMTRKGKRAELAQAIATKVGVILPHGAWMTQGEDLSLVGTAPGAGLAIKEDAHPDWADELAKALGDTASVVDLSGGFGVLRLSGPAVLPLMAKSAFIDFETFKVHQTAVTQIGHVGVTLWRMDDDCFEIATPRSYALDLWHWLQLSAAEYGLAWDQDGQGENDP